MIISFFGGKLQIYFEEKTGKEFYGAARGARILDLLNHNQAF